MSGTSRISTRVSIRLPNEVVRTLERKINGRRSRWGSVGELPEGTHNLRHNARAQTKGGATVVLYCRF